MSDYSNNFQVPSIDIPGGIRIHARAELWPVGETTMRYLSRPPMWEPPARPTVLEPAYAGLLPGPAPVTDGTAPARDSTAPARDSTAPARDSTAPARDGTADVPVAIPQASPVSVSAVEVRRAVEGVLRLALEVVDRRRRPDQLRAMATQPVIDALAALSVSSPPGRELGSAVLRKIRIVSAGERSAEICASYARGPRVFAIAGRIERRRERWVATSLMLA